MSSGIADPVNPRVQRTHDTVMTAARRLLVEEGLEAVTHLRVAEASGVGRATMYRHWPDSSSLLVAVLASFDYAPRRRLTGVLRDDLLGQLRQLREDLRDPGFARAAATLIERSQREEAYARVLTALRHAAGGGQVRRVIADAVERRELDSSAQSEWSASVLAGPIFYARLITLQPLEDAFLEYLVDSFLRLHAPAGVGRDSGKG